MKTANLLIISLVLCMCFSGMSSGKEAPQEPIAIKGRRPVVFDHAIHLALGLQCGICHHKSENQLYTNEEVKVLGDGNALKCRSCHNQNFQHERLGRVKIAMHLRCKGCHKAGVDGVYGPIGCVECHKKQN